MPAGRPSKYKPEFCEKIIEVAQRGGSITRMAIEGCGVEKATMYDWAEAHPEFSNALTRAREISQLWWEKKAEENVDNPKFNAALWKMNVASRFREEYGETKKSLEISGPNGGPIETKATVIEAKSMDDNVREALRYALQAVDRTTSASTDEPYQDEGTDEQDNSEGT